MNLRLVHVDDEADLRELVDMSLSLDPEFEVRSRSSGAEALVLIESWAPDVLLLDYMLPEMDGAEIFARLISRGGPPATIFLTARTAAGDIQRLKDLGAIGVIAKPFDPMTLAAEIKRLLGGG